MPQGLQVWDAAGSLIVDTSVKLARLLGVQVVGVGNPSGNLVDANFAQGTPWYFIIGQLDPYNRPDVSIAGTTLTWTSRGSFTGSIMYGVM